MLADPGRVLFRGSPSAVLLDTGTPPAQAYAQIKAVRPKSPISYALQALYEHIAQMCPEVVWMASRRNATAARAAAVAAL